MFGSVVLEFLVCMLCMIAAELDANLRHAWATDRAAASSEFPKCKHQRGSERGEQEPHEDEAGLNLAAALLCVAGPKGDPVGRLEPPYKYTILISNMPSGSISDSVYSPSRRS
ncbi:hypothetical protein NUW58_g9807 [Xylaria curta]|uniref:Uncharacterized protein n=1 Tax=Xylaria curta TaxID=42375 RepID=A0ACC1MSU4_9PEZI|nr:hypothetical protein NUW58_g9807 [Xylaria curta]